MLEPHAGPKSADIAKAAARTNPAEVKLLIRTMDAHVWGKRHKVPQLSRLCLFLCGFRSKPITDSGRNRSLIGLNVHGQLSWPPRRHERRAGRRVPAARLCGCDHAALRSCTIMMLRSCGASRRMAVGAAFGGRLVAGQRRNATLAAPIGDAFRRPSVCLYLRLWTFTVNVHGQLSWPPRRHERRAGRRVPAARLCGCDHAALRSCTIMMLRSCGASRRMAVGAAFGGRLVAGQRRNATLAAPIGDAFRRPSVCLYLRLWTFTVNRFRGRR